MKILISNNPRNLQNSAPDVTVEAEYGEVVVQGLTLTMAHHGPRAGQPAPCSYPNGCAGDPSNLILGISHVDLDTVGGIMAVLGSKPDQPSFWNLAEFVDLNGAHKLQLSDASDRDKRSLMAYWAFSRSQRVFAPRDGSVADVTEVVLSHIQAVQKILDGEEDLLVKGDLFRAEEDQLNLKTFRSHERGVILRSSSVFVNHLYTTPNGEIAKAVVTHNPSSDLPGGAVTVSLADPHPTINVGKLLGELFGPEAGGHAGIGGSPRGVPLPYEEAERVAKILSEQLQPLRPWA